MRTAPEEVRSDEPERIDTEPPVLTFPCRGRVRGAAGLYQHVAAAADPAGAKLMSPPAPVALAPVARVCQVARRALGRAHGYQHGI
jgi:hypothetical protein